MFCVLLMRTCCLHICAFFHFRDCSFFLQVGVHFDGVGFCPYSGGVSWRAVCGRGEEEDRDSIHGTEVQTHPAQLLVLLTPLSPSQGHCIFTACDALLESHHGTEDFILAFSASTASRSEGRGKVFTLHVYRCLASDDRYMVCLSSRVESVLPSFLICKFFSF